MRYNLFMKQVILLAAVILLIQQPVSCKHLQPEKYYQEQWCSKHKGVVEHKLSDKARVDCLTDKYAVEFDFAPKWAECIGQALYYGKMTGKQPACVLIMERGEKDLRYLKRLRKAVYKNHPGMRTFTIQPTPANKCF